VNIAQRGRSLGIHLILATQRPSGVISPEIRANTNLRVALRMTDKSESKDVIDANEAAEIAKSQPGRGYARLGHSSVIPFQSARVGGRRLSLTDLGQIDPPFVARVSVADLGAPPPSRPRVKRQENVETDLAALVETLRETARLGGCPRCRTCSRSAHWCSRTPGRSSRGRWRTRPRTSARGPP
jgi:S-DNA-T family DNA segregation ATPase FtsK/SpoIIIE